MYTLLTSKSVKRLNVNYWEICRNYLVCCNGTYSFCVKDMTLAWPLLIVNGHRQSITNNPRELHSSASQLHCKSLVCE